MKTNKKILAIMIAAILLITLLPSMAFADDPVLYNLWVGGVQVTSEYLENETEGWSYNPETSTLTLNNANITATGEAVEFVDGFAKGTANIYSKNMDLNMVLAGTSSISGGEYGIAVEKGSLTINGGGSIDVKQTFFNGVRVSNGITLENITFSDTTGHNCTILTGGNIIIKNSKVTVIGASIASGMEASSGKIEINNSYVEAKAEYGAYARNGITLTDVAVKRPEGGIVFVTSSGSSWIGNSSGGQRDDILIEPVPKYTVTFKTNGGSPVEDQTIAIGGTATKPEDPTKDGYSFYKWFGDEACTTPFDFTQAIDGDTTVYAYWLKNISGFKIHTDGTEKGSDGYYNVKADVTEVLFEKDTADVSVDVKPLSKDPADYTDANKLKEAPETGKEYYFHVELTDVNGQPGRPTVKDNDKLKTGTEATAENATITLMDVAHSADERVFTMVFKYVENEPEPEPEPDPEPKPDPDPEPKPDPDPEPEPVVKPVYWVSEGTDLTVSEDSAEGLKLTVHRKPGDDLTFSLFTGVEMDGKQLASSDYTAASGSLKLTVKPSYIKGLAVGSHTLKVKFSDGEATANVKVTEASDNPRTGDESGLMLWILIAVIAAGGIIAALLVYRKQSKRE